MGMMIHPRYFVVQEAKNEIGRQVIESVKKHGLSAIEVVSVLIQETASWHKYALREERHPDDPEKKADEA